jgi:tetratricopeptide (TPR) repeat protein
MAEETKRNRWLPRIVLAFASIALIGVSIFPYLNTTKDVPSNVNTAASPDAQRKQFEDQVRGYESVLQREPENPNALRGIVDAKKGLNDIAGTVAPLEKLVKLNPTAPDYAILLARTKQYLKDNEGAIQVYRDALKVQPADLQILGQLSQLLIEQKRPEAAIGLLQDTLRDAPKLNQATPGAVDVTAVEVLLGRTFANQKRFDEAVRMFDGAIKAKPTDFQGYLGKALTLQEQGKKDEAKALFDKALTVAPPEVKDQISRLAAGPTPSPAANPTASPAAGGVSPDAQRPPTDKPADTKPETKPEAKPEEPAPAKP